MSEKMSAPEITLKLSSLERIRIIDLCFRAFMNAREPNNEDGGATDWFNDTLPALQPGIDAFNAHITALQSEADDLRADIDVAKNERAFLQSEADRLRQSIAWVGEVYPDTNHESGGAIVHMTWDQFNAMREMVGLKSVKPARARAALSATQQDVSPVQPAQKTE